MLGKTLLGFTTALLLAIPAAPQTVDDVIAKSLEARGGKERLKAIRSLRILARTRQGETSVPLTIEMKRPSLFRADFKVEGVAAVMAFDGRVAWGLSPVSRRAERLPEEAARGMADRGDIDGPLVDYAEKGHTAQLVRNETLDGHDTFKIRLTKKNGDVEYHFIDALSFLPLRIESRQQGREGPVVASSSFADYRPVAGFLWPFRVENEIEGAGESQTIRIESVAPNVEIDDARFSMADRR